MVVTRVPGTDSTRYKKKKMYVYTFCYGHRLPHPIYSMGRGSRPC